MTQRFNTQIGHILRNVLILGIALLAFAHAPLTEKPSPPLMDMVAYTMPDGTLPTLCVTGDVSGKSAHHPPCPACHLTAECPSAQPEVALIGQLTQGTIAPRCAQIAAPANIAAVPPQPRAPPVLTA